MGPRQFSASIGHSFRVARRVETQSAGSENDGGLCSASKRAAELTESPGFLGSHMAGIQNSGVGSPGQNGQKRETKHVPQTSEMVGVG